MKYLVLNISTVKKLEKLIRNYMNISGVSSVFIVNTAGQMLFHRGMTKSDYFLQSIGALGSGIFNATKSLAKLLKEDYFTSAFQEGKSYSFYYFAVTEDIILISIYGKNTIVGVVQVTSKKAANDILKIMSEKKEEKLATIGEDFKAEVETLIDNMFK